MTPPPDADGQSSLCCHPGVFSGRQPRLTRRSRRPTETGRNIRLAPLLRRDAPGSPVSGLQTRPRGRGRRPRSRRDRQTTVPSPLEASGGESWIRALPRPSVATSSRRSWGAGVGEPTDRPASRHTAGDSDAGATVHGAPRCTRGLGPASGGFPGPGVTRRSLLSH